MTPQQLEQLLRQAFRAAKEYGEHQSYFDKPADEDEWIESLSDATKKVKVEQKYPFAFHYLDQKIDWAELSDIIGIDYYRKTYIDLNEVFYIKESVVKRYNLINL